jgi:3-hydroxyisobutyrate dehydrogenase
VNKFRQADMWIGHQLPQKNLKTLSLLAQWLNTLGVFLYEQGVITRRKLSLSKPKFKQAQPTPYLSALVSVIYVKIGRPYTVSLTQSRQAGSSLHLRASAYKISGENMNEKIGFIGLGIMGRGMVQNLLDAGFIVTIWNRTENRMSPFIDAGALAGASPADVAAKSDITFICVSDTPDAEAVILGENGVIHGAEAGSLVVDHSTISPVATKAMAAELALKGVHMLDAPISGGSEGAANGTLSIMVGGDEAQFARAMPAFEAMGKTITHVGETGAGQTVKLVNQILVVITMWGVSEALLFAEAGGLDLEKTLTAVSGGAAGSWSLSNRGPQMIERDWRPGFTIDLQQKDLRLVLEAADQFGVPTLGTSTVFQLYRTLQQQGLGSDGNHALVKALEHLAGFEINPNTH